MNCFYEDIYHKNSIANKQNTDVPFLSLLPHFIGKLSWREFFPIIMTVYDPLTPTLTYCKSYFSSSSSFHKYLSTIYTKNKFKCLFPVLLNRFCVLFPFTRLHMHWHYNLVECSSCSVSRRMAKYPMKCNGHIKDKHSQKEARIRLWPYLNRLNKIKLLQPPTHNAPSLVLKGSSTTIRNSLKRLCWESLLIAN